MRPSSTSSRCALRALLAMLAMLVFALVDFPGALYIFHQSSCLGSKTMCPLSSFMVWLVSPPDCSLIYLCVGHDAGGTERAPAVDGQHPREVLRGVRVQAPGRAHLVREEVSKMHCRHTFNTGQTHGLAQDSTLHLPSWTCSLPTGALTHAPTSSCRPGRQFPPRLSQQVSGLCMFG